MNKSNPTFPSALLPSHFTLISFIPSRSLLLCKNLSLISVNFWPPVILTLELPKNATKQLGNVGESMLMMVQPGSNVYSILASHHQFQVQLPRVTGAHSI